MQISNSNTLLNFAPLFEIVHYYHLSLLLHLFMMDIVNYYILLLLAELLLINFVYDNPSVKPEDGSI